MKRIFTAAALVFLATAASAAAPKPVVVLESDVLTVGDVFDGAGDHAGYVLAPAPGADQPLTLSARDLQRIARAFSLDWQGDAGAKTVVRRRLHGADRYAIEAALQEKVSADLKGRKFDLMLADPSTAIEVPKGAETAVRVEDMRYDLSRGEFTARVAAGSVARDVRGRIFALTEVPVLNKALRNGDRITADDLDYVDMRSTDISAGMVVTAEALVGMTPRRSLPALRPVQAAEIEAPMMVKKGDAVTLVLQHGSLYLTAQGRALDSGSAGKVVRVMNTASNLIVEAEVTGDRAARVAAPAAALEKNI